jgi:predicted transcriptional regulator
MGITSDLNDIALGHANSAQARAALGAALRDASPESVQAVYTALRAWVWKALNERRRDEELREWFDVLRRTGSFLKERYNAHAERIQALHELIYESISVSEVLPPQEALKRLYVREIIRLLSRVPSGQMSRRRIRRRLDLKEANLSRILNLMMASGLVDRTAHGKEALFRLTNLGADAAKQFVVPPSPRAPAAEDHEQLNVRIRPTQVSENGPKEYTLLIHRQVKKHASDWSHPDFSRLTINTIRPFQKAARGAKTTLLRRTTRARMPIGHVKPYSDRGLTDQTVLKWREFPTNEPVLRPTKEIVSASKAG